MVRREYDIFEKFSDGSTLWRASVRGRFESQRKMDELAEHSENQFYMLDIQEATIAQPVLGTVKHKCSVRSAAAS